MALPRVIREVLRCPVCGQHSVPGNFLRGQLGHQLEALAKRQTEEGKIAWSKRPFDNEERSMIAHAVSKAHELIEEHGDEDWTGDPIDVLASLNREDAKLLASEWVKEAVDELERRTQIFHAATNRRT